ncbi:uncharacterized protein RAG0_16568 [Rhynchosporium agropyri]|uniref:Uncharacterized protein n=1 Tax=Rhynchosporium agropyri TaxID=914238 RepID=A0A1E1LQZ1_9HELO|nr:uncharacterized protein RAG0_16568 [Rhynchosporium agropyri]
MAVALSFMCVFHQGSELSVITRANGIYNFVAIDVFDLANVDFHVGRTSCGTLCLPGLVRIRAVCTVSRT